MSNATPDTEKPHEEPLSKTESAIRSAVDAVIRYCRTLLLSFMPWRWPLDEPPYRKLLPPLLYVAVSAFVTVVLVRLGYGVKQSFFADMRTELGGASEASMILRAVPTVVACVVLARLAGLVLAKSSRESVSLRDLPSYVAGLQLSLFALAMLALFIAGIRELPWLESISIVLFVLSAIMPTLLMFVVAWRLGVFREAHGGIVLLLLAFIPTPLATSIGTAFAFEQLQRWHREDDVRTIFSGEFPAELIDQQLEGEVAHFTFLVRNQYDDTYIIHRDGRFLFPSSQQLDTVNATLSVTNSSAGANPPATVLQPHAIAWLTVKGMAPMTRLTTPRAANFSGSCFARTAFRQSARSITARSQRPPFASNVTGRIAWSPATQMMNTATK